MPQETNRAVLLVKRPYGLSNADCFALTEAERPTPVDGQVLVKLLYLSVDPYMRGRMSEAAHGMTPFALNQPMAGGAIGEVVESRVPEFAKGDKISGPLPWADYAVADGKAMRKVNTFGAPLSTALGVLGMPGLTAYFGLLDVGQPKEGETVVVSGAAGAVGTVVGQIAKIKGCRAVGIAGSDQKTAYIVGKLDFDEGINYHTAPDLSAAIAAACPDGVDVYFDNVGGWISDAVLQHVNEKARVPVCGQISQYNLEEPEEGPRIGPIILTRHVKMQGFTQREYTDRFGEALPQLGAWIKEGKLHYAETIVEGLENAPKAFIGLFSGNNIGKMVVKVSSEAMKPE